MKEQKTMFYWILLVSVFIPQCQGIVLTGVELVYEETGVNSTFNTNMYASMTVSRYAPLAAIQASFINTSNYVYFEEYTTKTAVIAKVDDILFEANDTQTPSVPSIEVEYNLQHESTAANPDTVRIQVFIYNPAAPANMAYGVKTTVDLSAGMQADYSSMSVNGSAYVSSVFDVVTITNGRKGFQWTAGDIPTSGGYMLEFVAEPSGDSGRDLNEGVNYFYINTYFYTEAAMTADVQVGPISLDICVNSHHDITESLLYQHGFTALAFFMAVILGVIIVIVSVCLWRFLTGRMGRGNKVRDAEHNILIHEKGERLVMNADKAMKGRHTITDYSKFNEDESIVGILGMKDRLQRHREIDNQDIVSTVHIDEGIENERTDASENMTLLYIQALKHNKDLSPADEDKVISNHKRRKGGLNKKLDDDYNSEKKKLLRKLSAKNKAKMSRLHQKQKVQKKKLFSEVSNLGDDERKELVKLVDEQQQTEQNEETYRLKLEQDEEMENLRKEFVAWKRMGIKGLQHDIIKDVQEGGRMSDEKANWLIKEHKDAQSRLDNMYDAEISKQRMQLEERLERRRALAKMSETTEDDMSDELNTMASAQVDFINRAKKQGIMSTDEAADIMEQAKKDMLSLKDKMDADRTKQEDALHKKLSVLKKQRMDKLKAEQKEELSDYDRKNVAAQADGPVDPLSFAEGRYKLQAKHREEVHRVSNQVDKENADELLHLRDSISTQTEESLNKSEQGLIDDLRQKGLSDDAVNQLINKHKANMARLEDIQAKNLQRQQQELKERLEKNRAMASQRNAAEKNEQVLLRQRQEKIVDKLITGQMVMSDEERDKIMQEHEKQMVQLENNLTLNKLRQKRMLEEKLQQKRSRQLHKLQEKHEQEAQIQQRKLDNNGEDSDEESQREKLELMKHQFEQRMAIMQGQKLNIDDEMENVRIEMLKQRAFALKDQEERLGAMVAALQMSKAKELSRIDEQQQAINNLKANLMDDLSDRGILDNSECQEIIQRYKQEQNQLQTKLDLVQKQQEKILKKRLKARLEQREEGMRKAQEQELTTLLGTAKNKTAAKIKRMLLIHKHMVAMEQMRNRLEREISQTLQETKRQFEVKRLQEIQNQEFEFLKGLVAFGNFPKEELIGVVQTLFPTKTDQEVAAMVEKIYDPRSQNKQQQPVDPNAHKWISLKDRVQASAHETPRRRLSSANLLNEKRGSLKGSLRKPKKKYLPQDNEAYDDYEEPEEYTRHHRRPEPIGEVKATQQEDDYIYAQQKPSGRQNQLPPLTSSGGGPEKVGKKKKKKKLLNKLSKPRNDENIYDADDLL